MRRQGIAAAEPSRAISRAVLQPVPLKMLRAILRSIVLPLALVVGALAASSGAVAAPAGGGTDESPVHIQARGPAEPVPAGGAFVVAVDVTVDSPYHVYGHGLGENYTSTELLGETAGGLVFERADPSDAEHEVHDEILDETYRVLEGRFTLRAHFRVEPGVAPGKAVAKLSLRYQACDDRGCLLPMTDALEVPVTVRAALPGDVLAPVAAATTGASGGPAAGTASGTASGTVSGAVEASLQDQFQVALAAGNVGTFLWLAVVLALVSLLTPCVFPMIPITVSFFSKRDGEAGGRGVSYALVYGLGIVATYTGFGVGMAALLGASSLQTFATHPGTNLAIGALFVFFGLSLMGFYDLRPPAFLARRAEAGAVATRPGYLPVFVMGFVFTVTAFTCTAPIVGTLLAATSSVSPALIVGGMLVYSAAFALPFVLLAMFPGALSALPGAGGWMITVKVVLGFLEVIAALKFFSAADLVWNLQLMPRPVMLLAAALILAVLALYLFGAFRLPHDVPGRRRALSARTAVAVLVVLASLYFARGLGGRTLDSWTESFLPPDGYGAPAGAARADAVPWIEDFDKAQAEARRTGMNLFIDFTGVTCQNCRKNEKAIFRQARFAEACRRIVPVRLYTDRLSAEFADGDAANRRRMEQLGSVTLPLYVLMSPEGKVLRQLGYRPGQTVEEFIAFQEAPPP